MGYLVDCEPSAPFAGPESQRGAHPTGDAPEACRQAAKEAHTDKTACSCSRKQTPLKEAPRHCQTQSWQAQRGQPPMNATPKF